MTFEEWKKKNAMVYMVLASDMAGDGIDPGEIEWFIEDLSRKEYNIFLESEKK